jgi:GR25 family glycosyltransferase involved in LPS biosynthesis
MKIFVTHYTPLTNRKEHILNEFNKHNIKLDDVEFIETHDREVLTDEELNKFVKINNSERSLFLKHIEIFKKIVNTYGTTLIFEDDAVLIDNFQDILKDYILNLPENFDLVFPGEFAK